jgi:hypothetical protein
MTGVTGAFGTVVATGDGTDDVLGFDGECGELGR